LRFLPEAPEPTGCVVGGAFVFSVSNTNVPEAPWKPGVVDADLSDDTTEDELEFSDGIIWDVFWSGDAVGARFSDGIVDEELCFSDGITWDVFSPAEDVDMDISETRPTAGDASDL